MHIRVILPVTGESLVDHVRQEAESVAVVDRTGAAVTWLESCARLRIAPSRTTYMAPPAKDRTS